MCHCLIWRYLDFQSIMGRTCPTNSTSFWHSPAISTISEHGKMIICDDQHQIFGVCNRLCKNSRRPRKSTNPQRMAHSLKHSWTKKFSWFGEFLLTIHTWLQPHCTAFESVDKRKWENCLQMDTNTTTIFWTSKKKPLYCTSTCVTWFASTLWDWDGCIGLCPRHSDYLVRSPSRVSLRYFQWHN